MRRGAVAALAVAAVASAAIVLVVRHRAAPARRPNIVVILIDTLRRDHLPFHGYTRDTAPFLTGLAAQGVVFDQAYSTSGWTSPATASLFTSLYPFQHGVIVGIQRQREEEYRFHRLPRTVTTLAESLKHAGYATYAISDNINVSPITGFDPGFDGFESASDATAVAVNKRAKKWRAEITSRAPYFLYLHYLDPHEPYLPHAPWFETFMHDDRPSLSRRDFEAAYDSEIRFVDQKIAGLFEDYGWDEDTFLVVTADHGEEFGDHGHAGHAHTLYSELVNVPLLMYRGGAGHPRRVDAAVSLIDVLPTLREVAGLPPDPRNEGVSLLPLFRGQGWPYADRPLFSEIVTLGSDEVITAAIRRRWKTIDYQAGTQALYDLEHDAREQADHAGERPDLLRDLRGQYATYSIHARKYGDSSKSDVVLDPASIEKLRALGYVQ
jgi:arylsulfatase A-like enzyme